MLAEVDGHIYDMGPRTRKQQRIWYESLVNCSLFWVGLGVESGKLANHQLVLSHIIAIRN